MNTSNRFTRAVAAVTMAGGLLIAAAACAEADSSDTVEVCEQAECSEIYPATFFDRYSPVNALEMVENLPAFSLDNGGGSRGFAGSAGNVLINGERVSAKSERPSDLLRSIPSARVESIEVIRGQSGSGLLRGQTVIANIRLKRDSRSATWTLGSNFYNHEIRPYPFARGSWSLQRGDLETTISARGSRYRGFVPATETVLDAHGTAIEQREEVFDEDGWNAALAVQAGWAFDRGSLQLNGLIEAFDEDGGETSIRRPLDAASFTLFQGDTDEEQSYELGVDWTRELGDALQVKLIGLNRSDDFLGTGSLGRPEVGQTDLTTRSESRTRETILRSEALWTPQAGHQIGAAIEAAENRLRSDFELRSRIDGSLAPVDVPGASTRVEETRFDAAVTYSTAWNRLFLDLEAAAEQSTIDQSGDFTEKRRFRFFKPAVTITFAHSDTLQIRLDSRRKVAQLDFSDFVSAADLGDQELELGNPDLAPSASWDTELTIEHRFGDLGLVSLTGFHDEIADVVGQLPLGDGLEVPGNIGDGSRSGLRANLTLPLDAISISGGRLDIGGRWQHSEVEDPITAETRPLSDERTWQASVAFRQDLPEMGLAWGGDVSVFDEYPRFGLDEIDEFQSGVDLDAFIEKRTPNGLVFRLGVENILENATDRTRAVFDGPRDQAPILFIEQREPFPPRRFFLQLSGTI